jgi:hypothetical protein
MEAVCSSVLLAYTYKTTWHNIPEDRYLQKSDCNYFIFAIRNNSVIPTPLRFEPITGKVSDSYLLRSKHTSHYHFYIA